MLSLRLAAALSIAKASNHCFPVLCTPAEDRSEFERALSASGLRLAWFDDFNRVGVGSVLDACSMFDGSLRD